MGGSSHLRVEAKRAGGRGPATRELLRGLYLQSPLPLGRPSRAHGTHAFGEPAPQEPAYQDAQNSCFTTGNSCYVLPSAAVDTPGVAWAPDTAVRRTGYDVCPRGTALQSGGGKKLQNGTCSPTMWQFFVQDKSNQHLALPHLLWPEMDSPPFWRLLAHPRFREDSGGSPRPRKLQKGP